MTPPTRRRFGALMGAGLLALATGAFPRAGRSRAVHPAHRHPEPHRITITRFRFAPARLTVRPGDRVEWRNRDLAPHTATASAQEQSGRWDTGRLKLGEAGEVTFGEPGRHTYYCIYHPHMTGEIIVAAED